jgi:hypothetical protein
MAYTFYGNENADVTAVNGGYPGIRTPKDLYDVLCGVWCEYTCAPRLRQGYSRRHITSGQCSITAFLVQDIFGGRVYGILRPGGNYHCYNDVDGHVFDLTSEQFGDEKLCYEGNPEQFREVHFAKEEKRLRYELLCRELQQACGSRRNVREQEETMRADLNGHDQPDLAGRQGTEGILRAGTAEAGKASGLNPLDADALQGVSGGTGWTPYNEYGKAPDVEELMEQGSSVAERLDRLGSGLMDRAAHASDRLREKITGIALGE